MRRLLILLAAGALVVGYSLPASAQAEFSFYGTIRVGTFMHDISKEASTTGIESEDDLAFTWDRSIFGVNVEAGDITGKFAYWQMYGYGGVGGGQGEAAELWGSWNFGAGSLLVGRNWAPVNVFISNQVAFRDIDLLLMGACFTDTQPLIQLSIGGLKVAMIETSEPGGVVTGAVDTDTSTPKFEVRYDFTVGPVSLGVFGGINSYDEVTTPTATTVKDYGIDSSVFGAVGTFGVGAASIRASAYTGTNLAEYNVLHFGDAGAYYDGISDSVKDNDTMGYCLVVNYKVSDTLSIEGGYGFTESEVDMPGTWEDETSSWYVNAVIVLAEGVSITPEIGVLDYMEKQWGTATATKEGDDTYWGAKWQIDW